MLLELTAQDTQPSIKECVDPLVEMTRGKKEEQLGHLENAYQAYSNALSAMQNRAGIVEPTSADMQQADEQLWKLDVVFGNYATAQERVERLAPLSPKHYYRSFPRLAQDVAARTELRRSITELYRNNRFEEAARQGVQYLGFTGAPDTEIELIVAVGAVNYSKGPSVESVSKGYQIARRIQREQPDNAHAWGVLGFVSEKAAPVSEIGMSPHGILSLYKKALILDPSNELSNRRYESLTNKRYHADWESKVKLFGYQPNAVLPLSPRLAENADAQLNVNEISWYWNQHTSEYTNLIDDLDEQIDRPMADSCRLTICIPSFMEEKNIARTLEHFTRQKGINPAEFEIIVLENHPDDPQYQRDGTSGEITQLKGKYPDLMAHHVYKPMSEDMKAMGFIRKVLFDFLVR